MIRQGRIGPGDGANNGGNNVQFCPLHERAQFTTWDEYPSRVLLAQEPTGKKVFDQIVRYAHGKKDTHTKTGHLKYMPELITTAPLREKGIYTVTDRRHPWIKGYLFVVDNPYVTVTTCRRPGKLSIFNIGGVPPGTHTVEVWHPFLEPVQRTFQVKVEASRITEVLIEFHPPAPPGGRTRPATPKAPPTKKPA
ncbi:unnamed protein product [marine sediment metagenome]|uniref:Rhamnogalacturonan lyase domain-containing protein n=1 Tax=marine sediment metagenome TaxID=412755 RepID=X0T8B9_9ZZZZ